MGTGVTELNGARFFDCDGNDRGWARRVTHRDHPLSGMTILDVIHPPPELSRFLVCLDHIELVVQCTGDSASHFRFRWASGYENGEDVRVQGVIEVA